MAISAVTAIRPAEGVSLDPVRLSEIFRELGPAGAEGLIGRAMEELAALMAALADHHGAGRFDDFTRGLRSLRRLADHTGLPKLSRAANAVADCTASGDATALAATWNRLLRLSARATCTGADIEGVSG